jgi:hypothetical protein
LCKLRKKIFLKIYLRNPLLCSAREGEEEGEEEGGDLK